MKRRFAGVGCLVVLGQVLLLAGQIPKSKAWKAPFHLNSPGLDRNAGQPSIAVSSDGRIHSVWREAWSDGVISSFRIRYREFDGVRWLDPVDISPPWPSAASPSIVLDGAGQPHVVWLERGGSSSKSLVRHSLRAHGEEWSAPRRVSPTERIGSEGRPQLVIGRGGDLLVVWSDDDSRGNTEVFSSRWVQGDWQAAESISRVDAYHSGEADLRLLADGRSAVVWVDRMGDHRQAYLRIHDGTGWSNPFPVGPALVSAANFRLAAGRDLIHVFYSDLGGIYVLTTVTAMSWEEPVRLVTSIPGPRFEVAPIDEGTVLTTFVDREKSAEVLLSIRYLADFRTFEGIPSRIALLAEPKPALSLAASATGEASIAWCRTATAGQPSTILESAYLDAALLSFQRGDLDGLGIDLGDAIGILLGIFSGGSPIPCVDAADANDDGKADIADILWILEYLFREGPPPLAPWPLCEPDPTPDDLDCEAPACRE